jgi:HSP20 family protein
MSNISRPNSGIMRAAVSPTSRLFPSPDLGDLRRGMDDLFGRWFGETPFGSLSPAVASFTPAVDLWETPEAYVLCATLPGVSKEDLELEVTGDTISIKGERKPATQESNIIYHIQNIGYGRFSAAYSLPAHIDASGVTADYVDGVLTMTLPKVETAKTRTIKVNITGDK